jgi:flagellar hook-length control protein FliK
MLTQRGMKLGDLSFVQMSKLAQMNTKSSVTAFLDQLSKERKMHGVEEKEETTLVERGKENMARRMEGSQELTGQASPAADLKEAMEGRPVPSDRAKELAERKEVVDQIVRHVEIRNLNSRDELVMRLNPEYLGELKLKISKEGGKMSALFETTSQEVRAIIEESADELTSMFGSKGLTLTGAKVKLVGSIE